MKQSEHSVYDWWTGRELVPRHYVRSTHPGAHGEMVNEVDQYWPEDCPVCSKERADA